MEDETRLKKNEPNNRGRGGGKPDGKNPAFFVIVIAQMDLIIQEKICFVFLNSPCYLLQSAQKVR
jgi:hypothetical protein